MTGSTAHADPAGDLAATPTLTRPALAFEASFTHRDGIENFRVVGFDSLTKAWYLIHYGTPVGIDHSGKSLGFVKGVLDYLPNRESSVRKDSAFIEQYIAPTLFLAGLSADNAATTTVNREDSGDFICTAALLASNRYDTVVGLPKGMIAQTATITVWADRTGLPTKIQRFTDGPVEVFDYDPSSMTKIPIARTADGGAWTLESLTWLAPNDPRFTLEGLRKRAAKSDTRPRKPEPPPLSAEAKAQADADGMRSAVASGIVSQSSLASYRWPLVITGGLLVTVGVVAYVRSRRQ